MAFKTRRDVLIQIFFCYLLSVFMTGHGHERDGGLCGEPLAPCSLDNSTGSRQSFKNGLIVGYFFSLTSVVVAYMSYFYCVTSSRLKQRYDIHRNKAKELGKYICSITSWKTRIIAYQIHKQISLLLERLTSTMSLEELGIATDFFTIDNAIGMGKMGIMYEGRLPNGWYLAVKRLEDSQLFKRQFLLETTILGKCRHRNIVPLLGFCIERKERILVYPYMSNGRLSRWLRPLESEVVRLRWPERVNIALGVARGLAWLHHSCNLHIVHFNICSECILLDENFEPKISNFGEAKFMNPNIEDDLAMMLKVDDGKKDVYDFGSVLFELITGKTFKELSSLSNSTSLYVHPSNFCNAIDKSLIGNGFENEIGTIIKIACECVQPLPDQRPTMLEVYNNMSNKWESQHTPSDDSDTSRGSEIVSDTSIDKIVQL